MIQRNGRKKANTQSDVHYRSASVHSPRNAKSKKMSLDVDEVEKIETEVNRAYIDTERKLEFRDLHEEFCPIISKSH